MKKAASLMIVMIITLSVIIVGGMLMKGTSPIFAPPQNQDSWQFGDFEDQGIIEGDGKIEDHDFPKNEPKIKRQIVARNLQDAMSKAKEHDKKILIVFGADWCHWCKELKRNTLSDSGVKKEMMEFVYLYVNSDHDKQTVRKYEVRGLPSYVIADEKGKKKKKGSGYKNPNEFKKWLD